MAFERVCQELGLTVKDDPATRLVAEKIIALAKSGTEDAKVLCDLTLQEFCKQTTQLAEGELDEAAAIDSR
jgi:hypothetical protein